MVSYFYVIVVCYIPFRTSFASDEIHYTDVIGSFIQRSQKSKLFYEHYHQKLFVDLDQVFRPKYEPELNTVSAWKLLHTGAAMATTKTVTTTLGKCVNSTLDTIVAWSRRETWAIRRMSICYMIHKFEINDNHGVKHMNLS